MGDVKNDKRKLLSIAYESVDRNLALEKLSRYFYIIFKVTAQNLAKGNATFVLTPYSYEGVMMELPTSSATIIHQNGEQKVKIKVAAPILEKIGVMFDVKVICDGISASTGKFKLDKEEDKAGTCFCNRNFTEQELRNIVMELRKNTTDQKGNKIFPIHKGNIFYLNVGNLPQEEQNNFKEFVRILNTIFSKFNINTCLRKIHFLAQVYPETQYFSMLKEKGENLKYDPFRGRGLIQLIGIEYPSKSGKWIGGLEDSRTGNATSYLGYKKYSKLDVINEPDLISNSLLLSADSAGWFWEFGKVLEDGSILNLNVLADKDNIDEVSKKVNGGSEARRQRREAYSYLKKVFNYDNCITKK